MVHLSLKYLLIYKNIKLEDIPYSLKIIMDQKVVNNEKI